MFSLLGTSGGFGPLKAAQELSQDEIRNTGLRGLVQIGARHVRV